MTVTPVLLQHRCYRKIHVFIPQQCPIFMFAWRGAMLMWDCCRDPHRLFVLKPSAHATTPARLSDFPRWPGMRVRLTFLCMRVSPSSLHPQCNLISLWHGVNFPLGGTVIPRHPSTLRLLMDCEADKNLSALKWGDKSSLDTHTHYIDIYSLVKKVVYWAHAPLCPFIQSRQIITQYNGMH